MGAPVTGRSEGRGDAGGEARGGEGAIAGEGAARGLPSAGVYRPRPPAPLGAAASAALDLPAGSPDGPDAAGEAGLDPLWCRPRLHGRLVQAVVEHAAERRPGRIVAMGRGVLPLAAPAALRLGLPLGLTAEPDGARPGGPRSVGAGPYLVAGILVPGAVEEFLAGSAGQPPDPVGAFAVLRRSPDSPGPVGDRNILSVIEL